MILEVISWVIILITITFIFFQNGKHIDKALYVLILATPVLYASVTSDFFLKGNVIRVIITLILIGIIIYNKKFTFGNLNVFYIYALFLIICIISSLISIYPIEAIFRTFTFFETLLFFFIAYIISLNYSSSSYWINFFIIFGLLLNLIIGGIEIITQNNPLSSQDFFFDPAVGDYILDQRTFSGRIIGLIGQPVYMAFYILCCTPVVVFFYLTSKNPAIKISLLIILVLSILLIYTTGTRSVYPLIIILGTLWFLFIKIKKYQVLIPIVILFFIISSLVTSSDVFYLSESFQVQNPTKYNVNAMQRLNLTERLYTIFLENFYVGFGPGIIQKMAFGENISFNARFSGLEGLENHYLVLLADSGSLGFISYITFCIYIVVRLRKICIEDHYVNLYRKLILMTFIVFLIGSITVSNLTSIPICIMFLLLGNYMGIVDRENLISNTIESN